MAHFIRSLIILLTVSATLTASAQSAQCQEVFFATGTQAAVAPLFSNEVEGVSAQEAPLATEELKLSKAQRKQLRRILISGLIAGITRPFKFLTGQHTEFQDPTERPLTEKEQELFLFLATMVEHKQLEPYLNRIVDRLVGLPFIGPRIKAQEAQFRGYLIRGGIDAIHALVEMRGLTSSSKSFLERTGHQWTPWQQLSEGAERKVKGLNFLGYEGHRAVSDPYFLKEFSQLTGARFVESTKTEVLVDGLESFAMRDQLIAEARDSIDIMVWAVLDDYTGTAFAKQMIEKVKSGVKVRLMVDGKVSRYHNYGKRLKEMEDAGVEVVRWNHPQVSYLIQHRKIMFVDGKSYIAGGINIGDTYSHKNPDPQVQRWRDTDVYVEGPAVQEALTLFAQLWNEQLDLYPQQYRDHSKVDVPERAPDIPLDSPKPKIALIESLPGPWAGDGTPILHAMMKAIRSASSTVDIENAYVVLNPALRNEIANAIKRGVRVRVFTNSDLSVDEAVVSKPIMKNARELAKLGAQVYLKKGHTLHSKVMIIDGRLSMVKSYNLHPRSERTDGEVAVVVDDPVFGRKMTAMFENDIRPDNAELVKNWEDVLYNESFLDSLMLTLSMRLGYDVL